MCVSIVVYYYKKKHGTGTEIKPPRKEDAQLAIIKWKVALMSELTSPTLTYFIQESNELNMDRLEIYPKMIMARQYSSYDLPPYFNLLSKNIESRHFGTDKRQSIT
jgi:hypothetical protein